MIDKGIELIRGKRKEAKENTLSPATHNLVPLAIACQAVPTTVGFCVAFVVKVSAPQESYGDI
jgi:hypothetical protein